MAGQESMGPDSQPLPMTCEIFTKFRGNGYLRLLRFCARVLVKMILVSALMSHVFSRRSNGQQYRWFTASITKNKPLFCIYLRVCVRVCV